MSQLLAIPQAGCRPSFLCHLLHRITALAICVSGAVGLQLSCPHSQAVGAEPSERPNVVLIMVDDMGYSDIGAYGGEIKTPHLDSLAENGIRFSSFYNTGRCWPTRGSLLTGYYAQQIRRDKVAGVVSGGRGVRPSWAPLLPKRLAPLGYRSYHCGKWHIDGMPVAQGFDRSYYLRDQGRFFYPQVHYLNDKKLPAVERGADYYGTTEIADRAIEFLKEHQRQHTEKPFFHYIAFTAPHFPLHALPEDIAKYKSAYQRDWEEVRRERFQRQRTMGLVRTELSAVERDLGPPYHFPESLKILGPGEVNRPLPWSKLSAEQQSFQSTKMRLHAAMIDRVDQEVGRILEQIRSMNAWENTLVLFLSDNGASAEIMVRTDGHDPAASPGSGPSYLCLGPGWSTTCNTPFRRHKTWVHEGGISTPLIAHWPAGIDEADRGKLCHQPGHVVDIVPTLLEVCGAAAERGDDGAKNVPSKPGRSLAQSLEHPEGESAARTLWWLHEGNRALRKGDWKLVAASEKPWELYDLRTDRAESDNLADRNPDLAKSLADQWQRLYEAHARHAKFH